MSNENGTTKKRTGGRRHKGPRHPSMVRFPVELYNELLAESQAAGYKYFADYVIDLCLAAPRDAETDELRKSA